MQPFISNGQRITVQDIQYGLTHSIGESEDYYLRKRLTFGGAGDLSDVKPSPKMYQFTNNDNNLNYLGIGINEFEGTVYESCITSMKESEYLYLRNQIKALGYKLESSNISDEISIVAYVKGNQKASFTIGRGKNGYKMYNVCLADIAKQSVMRFRSIGN
jgi:hypothetical protein